MSVITFNIMGKYCKRLIKKRFLQEIMKKMISINKNKSVQINFRWQVKEYILSSIVNDGIREFYTIYGKIPHAQIAQNAHKRIKTKTLLNVHKKHLKGRKSFVCYKKHKTRISE